MCRAFGKSHGKDAAREAPATVLNSLVWRSNLPFPKVYEGQYDAETVGIGNSRGVYAFARSTMEEVTGKRTANLSANGLTAQVSECLLRDYLDRNPAPKVVIAEASFIETETTAPVVMKLSPFFSESQRLFQLACSLDSSYSVMGRISKLMQYNSELTIYATMHLLSHGGRVVEAALTRKRISPEFAADTENMSPFVLRVEEAELQAVKRMADECGQRGIEFKLILAGYLPAYREKISNLQEWQDQIKEATGLEVTDLSDVGSNSAFFDRIHLNAEGSRRTAEMIVEQGLLN